MNILWKYLIESGLSLCLFYSIYWVFLRKDTFFARNRSYLALTIILSMIVPLISISIRQPAPIYTIEVMLDEAVIVPATSISSQSGFSWLSILTWIYWSGVGFFLFKFIFHTGQIYSLIRKHGITIEHGTRIVYLNRNISPFSFYNIIFLNRSLSGNEFIEKIIAHEKNHIRNRHTLDLIIFEILTIIQWFNPIAWLYKWSLKEVHEFQADDAVIREGHDALNYQELIISQVFGNQFFSIAHNLNKSLLKKRIIMMTKFKSSKISRYKIFLAIPVALLIISLFSFSGSQSDLPDIINSVFSPTTSIENQDTTVYSKVDTMPKFQGGDVLTFRKYLAMNLIYPKEAREKEISGKVFVQFVVTKMGKVEKIAVVRGVHPLLDKEAIRVIASSPDWEPGIKDGKKMDVALTFPVSFVLEENKDSKTQEKEASEVKGELFFVVEQMPKFQGSDDFAKFKKYVVSNLVYPEEALGKGISGRVFISFVVDKEGLVKDVKMEKGIKEFEKEGIRVIESSPKWEPGIQRGHKVNVGFTMPIVFQLPADYEKQPLPADIEGSDDPVFLVVEQMPRFQGSDDINKFKNHITENLVYPKAAADNKIEGRVIAQFVIDNEGKLGNIKIVRGVHPSLDSEAVKVLKNSDPDWEPGTQRGKHVNVAYTIPIVFKLQEKPMKNVQDETVVVGFKSKISDDVLYFVDGEAVSPEKVKLLNPDKINSIEVVKGEKAEEMYGSEGKNGVIRVFTKSNMDKDIKINLRDADKNSDLLMLINGKSASKEDFELLNLDQIESISVIKGKEAIEKYGKKAKEGVIIIIMK